MDEFTLNSRIWRVIFVEGSHPILQGSYGVTDPVSREIYISRDVPRYRLTKVVLHELAHAVIVSYHLTDYIRRTVYPERWADAEEHLCNFIADYGEVIFSKAYKILGDRAWDLLPRELERLVA